MSYEARVERVIDARAEDVFDAYSSVEAQRVWFKMGDDGQEEDMIVEITGDPVEGGVWDAAWGPSADEIYREHGVYRVVDRPHRLAMASTATMPDGSSQQSDVEVLFEDLGGRTRMTIIQRGLPDEATRDFLTDVALPGAFVRLQHYLRMQFA